MPYGIPQLPGPGSGEANMTILILTFCTIAAFPIARVIARLLEALA